MASHFGDVLRIKRTRAITVQTSQLLIVRQRGKSIREWCEACGKEISMVTLEQAVTITRRSSRELHSLIEAGQIHFAETAEGLVLICTNSLLKSNGERRPVSGCSSQEID
jgi:hypothetical protein